MAKKGSNNAGSGCDPKSIIGPFGIVVWENACAREQNKAKKDALDLAEYKAKQARLQAEYLAKEAAQEAKYQSGYTNPEAADITGAIAGPLASVVGSIIDPFSGLSGGLGGVLGDLGLGGTPTSTASSSSTLLLAGGAVVGTGLLIWAASR